MSDAIKIPAHSHCEICQKAITQGERFCSTECEEEHERRQAEKKKYIWKQVALIAGVMLVLVLVNRGII